MLLRFNRASSKKRATTGPTEGVPCERLWFDGRHPRTEARLPWEATDRDERLNGGLGFIDQIPF